MNVYVEDLYKIYWKAYWVLYPKGPRYEPPTASIYKMKVYDKAAEESHKFCNVKNIRYLTWLKV